MSKRYAWNFDRDAELWQSDSYDTIKECLNEVKEAAENDFVYIEERPQKVYIGECIEYVPCADVESMLERIGEQAYDQCGEVGYDWDACNYKKNDELKKLQDKINVVVHEWMKKYDYYPSFYSIENIKEYELESVDNA